MKGIEKRSHEEVRLCRYKREFLRRNDEYRQDYRAYTGHRVDFEEIKYPNVYLREGESIQEWEKRMTDLKWPKLPGVGHVRLNVGVAGKSDEFDHLAFGTGSQTSKANVLRQKYGINAGCPLKNPAEEYSLKPLVPFMPFLDRGVIEYSPGSTRAIELKPNEVLLKLNVRKPKGDLLADVEMYVDMARANLAMQGEPVHDTKRQLALYDVYLEVWDLREKGMTFDDIAGHLSAKPDAVNTDTVQVRYKAAQKLIEGGYRDI